MHNLEREFYEEIRDSIRSFSQHTIDGIRGKGDIEHAVERKELEDFRELNLSNESLRNLQIIIEEAAKGVVHALFVSIDGGTALSNDGKALELMDKKEGKPLTEGALHENFFDVF